MSAQREAADDDGDYDEEADEDFVPSEGSDDEEEGEEKEAKEEAAPSAAPAEESSAAVKDLWERLKAKTQTAAPPATTTTTTTTPPPPTATTKTETRTEVYDFAGERVTVQTTAPAATTTAAKRSAPTAGRGGRMLDAILGPKPKKMSTLDKSKLDWASFRGSQGPALADALDRARKSGGGYLDTQAFLARTDARQHDAERAAAARKRR